MGKLEEQTDGTYRLKVKIGIVEVKKAFKEIPLDCSENQPKQDGFYLHIPDTESGRA